MGHTGESRLPTMTNDLSGPDSKLGLDRGAHNGVCPAALACMRGFREVPPSVPTKGASSVVSLRFFTGNRTGPSDEFVGFAVVRRCLAAFGIT